MALPLPTFIARRLAIVLVVLVSVAALTFLIFHVLKPELFADQRSLAVQLGAFLERTFLHFDLGRSWSQGHRRVSAMVLDGLPADLSLFLGAMLLGTVGGLAGGAVCAIHPRAPLSRVLDIVATVAVCAPVYWVGLVAIYLFAPDIGSLPIPFVGGQGVYQPLTQDPLHWLQGLVLPWIVLAAPLWGMCLRMMRMSMQDVLGQDFVRTAMGKGLRWPTIVRRHAVPAGAAPVIALAGVNAVTVVTNAILLERTFNIPGVLRLTTRSMGSVEGHGTVDYPLLVGIVLVATVMIVIANLLADGLQAWLDPRVRA
jgi:peptide/nickel transport system permease protein